MKTLLIDICVAILRKLNVSVVIGYEIRGGMRAKNNMSRVYDNELDVDYRLANGDTFDIPAGEFTYTVDKKK